MEIAFKKLCLAENKNPVPKTLKILGHRITFPNTCGRVLYASFSDLCDKVSFII